MMKKLFVILAKFSISMGSIFLWMYLSNVGLNFVNASDDFLVMLGYGVCVISLIAMIMLNGFLWKGGIASIVESNKNKEKE